MPSIQDSPFPLAFKVGNADALGFAPEAAEGEIRVRTHVRALEGMQKEVLVEYGPTGTVWRMVCDEGPGLNGTDLAPVPLAFFNAGLLNSYAAEMSALARQRGLEGGFELNVMNRYTRTGSATQGTMAGGALPVELDVILEDDRDEQAWMEIVRQAVAASPADALMRTPLDNEFAIEKNGAALAPDRVKPLAVPVSASGLDLFEQIQPAAADEFAADVIAKAAGPSADAPNAQRGAALRDGGKRELAIPGSLKFRADGLRASTIGLRRAGSSFRFLSDDSARFGGAERAPSGLAYLSAGIALCFMTQVGRHAHMVKQDLSAYAVTQETVFSLPGASGGTEQAASASPVRSHARIEINEDDATARDLIDMGEQSCFLHAACIAPLKTKVSILTAAVAAE